MNVFKKMFLFFLKKKGYKLAKINNYQFGSNFGNDIYFLIGKTKKITIFDVGANLGQSISLFKNLFSKSIIYSFEPIPSIFSVLKNKIEFDQSIHLFNLAIGANRGTILFNENSESAMSSILVSGSDCWGDLKNQYEVPVVDIDSFCKDNNINFIHILKSDTQGFDFEVLKGASNMIKKNQIAFIYFEFIFSDMYSNLPNFSDVFTFLTVDNSYKLVSIYNFHYKDGKARWADVLFVSDQFLGDKL